MTIYWEVVEKRKVDGGIIDEFMLVSNNLRKDLMHANEYVVGLTLKLIGRIAIHEIIEVLLQPIYDHCLGHLESFVRRNAMECLYLLYSRFGDEIISNIEELLTNSLTKEIDINTKRNAIKFLFRANKVSALEYVCRAIEREGINYFADIIQLTIIRNIFKLCMESPSDRLDYLKIIYHFMDSPYNAVLFEIGL